MLLFLLKGLKELLLNSKVTSKKLTIFKLEEISVLNPKILNTQMIFFCRLDVLRPLLFGM